MDMEKKYLYILISCSVFMISGCGGSDKNNSDDNVAATAISPLEAIQGQRTNFTVVGAHLNENGITLSLTDCNDVIITKQAETQLIFSCTPQNTGNKVFSLNHKNNIISCRFSHRTISTSKLLDNLKHHWHYLKHEKSPITLR